MGKRVPNSEATQFKPGQSGNPNGQPRKLPSLDKLLPEVLGDDLDDNSKIKAILIKLADKAEKGDIRAAEILLDRAWGKPKQSIESDSKVDVTFNIETV